MVSSGLLPPNTMSVLTDINRAKTHCIRGHEFTPENTALDRGKRSCRICRRAADRARRLMPENHAKVRLKMHKRNMRAYGMTADDYVTMLSKQSGVCAICHGVNKSGKRLSVDHDHSTGKVRGLLCTNCNNGIGRFKDDPIRLVAAANYLNNAFKCEAVS